MLRFAAIFNCVISVLLGIGYNMQGLTPAIQILAALNLGMWLATIGAGVTSVVPWRTATETLCGQTGSLLRTMSAFKFSMQRRAYRKWGMIFYIIGAFACMGQIMDEHAPLYMSAVPLLIGVMLGIIGWIINHWPPSEYRQRTLHPYEFE